MMAPMTAVATQLPRLVRALRLGAMLAASVALAACGGGDLDWDLRPGSVFSTAEAARQTTSRRPAPDARGVITYPGYQVVVAQRGDDVRSIATRLGIDAATLARHNSIDIGATFRGGETLVIPGRVDAVATGPAGISATPLDGPTTLPGAEPVRHTVQRGETAFTIARLYNVSSRSLAEWNGLPPDLSVREGQILIIPVAEQGADTRTAALPQGTLDQPFTPPPGTGSATPPPPSAAQPLPQSSPAPAGQNAAAPAAPVADMAAQRTTQSTLAMPVDGRIIRAYQRGRNDGIGIGAPAGTTVRAAAAGTVAAITRDTQQVQILVIRHENNLLTVYANVDNITVARGDRVTRGQAVAVVRQGDPSFLHFEVRQGQESVDPVPLLQ